MSTPGETDTDPQELRRVYNVGAVKIAYADRDVAHAAITPDDDRGFADVLGADTADDDERFPIGSPVTYAVELTDAEAAAFAAASNARYVTPQRTTGFYKPRAVGRPTGLAPVPSLESLAWMRARYVDLRRWHGRDVRVAILDDGVTTAVRTAMGYTLIARGVFHPGTASPANTSNGGHGCNTASNAIPAGGLLLDAVVWGQNAEISDTGVAQAITWAVDNAAKLMVISVATGPGAEMGQVVTDAATYARTNGVHIVVATGNDDTANLSGPSNLSRSLANVHSIIAFNESTDRRASFSNYAADASGCAPGIEVLAIDPDGSIVRWDGTSAASPMACHLMVRALTGGQFTPNQVGAAFKANTRNTGAPATEQGAGAYDLHRALAALGQASATAGTAGVATPSVIGSFGGAAGTDAYAFTLPAAIQPDDLQIVILVAQESAQLARLRRAQILGEFRYTGGWEASPINPIVVWILAQPYVAGQANPLPVAFSNGARYSAGTTIVVRGAGGLDPERFVPQVRFGTGSTISSVPVSPATTNDLLICAFAQRQASASTAALSLPSGLTQRGLFRPSVAGIGFALLTTTTPLTGGGRTGAFSSISNDLAGTWCSIAFTVPGGDLAIPTVVQSEPAGPPNAFAPFLPRG